MLDESMFKSEHSNEFGSKSHRKPAITILEEENKELKAKLLLATKTMDSLNAKLDAILKKNQDITDATMAKHKKDSDSML